MVSGRIEKILSDLRESADERVWGAAVKLAREGAVQGVEDDGEEIHLRVKSRGRPVPHEVYLWPAEQDWGCDCEQASGICVHVCAAAIALQQAATAPSDTVAPSITGGPAARPLPQPKK